MRKFIFAGATVMVVLTAATVDAQGWHGPPFGGPRVFVGGFYGPYYPYYPAFGFGQWYPSPYPGPVFGYPTAYYPGGNAVSVRTLVTPRETQVFVDGYAAGTVDDFDGTFQRLQLVPGHHEIVFYLPGYRTYRENIYSNPGSSHSIRHTMDARLSGEPDEAPPVPQTGPMMGMPPGTMAPPAPQASSATGTLALRVQPGDAVVLIDGGQAVRLTLLLPAGRHHLQIEKSGFQSFAVDIEVRAGETTSLDVSLTSQ